MTQLVLAAARQDVGDFVQTLVFVYVILIIAYIIISMVFSFGARVPYSRWSDAVLTFLRDVCEPYLRPFRKVIPPIGPLDISPIVAIFVLQIGGSIVANLIRG